MKTPIGKVSSINSPVIRVPGQRSYKPFRTLILSRRAMAAIIFWTKPSLIRHFRALLCSLEVAIPQPPLSTLSEMCPMLSRQKMMARMSGLRQVASLKVFITQPKVKRLTLK